VGDFDTTDADVTADRADAAAVDRAGAASIDRDGADAVDRAGAAAVDRAGAAAIDRAGAAAVDRADETVDQADVDQADEETVDVPALVGPAPDTPPPADRPGSSRRLLAPLLVVAVVLALVGATWAIARTDVTVTGTPSAAPGAAPASAAAPSSAAPASAAAGPALTEAVFTGRTSDNAITLAVGIKNGRAAGYLCDGSKVEAWLEGDATGGKITLRGRDPSTVVEGTVSEQGLFGTITVAGASRPFAAKLATGPAGLYQSKRVLNGIASRIGWIVLPDGTQVGIRNENGVRTPAPRLDPATAVAVDGGTSIPAERVTGATVVLGG
jgi:hypothetical protein